MRKEVFSRLLEPFYNCLIKSQLLCYRSRNSPCVTDKTIRLHLLESTTSTINPQTIKKKSASWSTFFEHRCHEASVELMASSHISSVGPAGDAPSIRPPNIQTFGPKVVNVWPDLPDGFSRCRPIPLIRLHTRFWLMILAQLWGMVLPVFQREQVLLSHKKLLFGC